MPGARHRQVLLEACAFIECRHVPAMIGAEAFARRPQIRVPRQPLRRDLGRMRAGRQSPREIALGSPGARRRLRDLGPRVLERGDPKIFPAAVSHSHPPDYSCGPRYHSQPGIGTERERLGAGAGAADLDLASRSRDRVQAADRSARLCRTADAAWGQRKDTAMKIRKGMRRLILGGTAAMLVVTGAMMSYCLFGAASPSTSPRLRSSPPPGRWSRGCSRVGCGGASGLFLWT